MFNDREELKKWITDYINNKSKMSLHTAIKNSKEIQGDIIKYTDFLPPEVKFNQRCFHIINDLMEITKCLECNRNVNFSNLDREWKYLKYCSKSCSNKSKHRIDNYKKTSLSKWGVDNYSKTNEFKERMIQLNNHRYGVDWYQQSEEFREKSIKTCLEKYGVTSFTKTEEFKNKLKKIFLENWGVDWYSKSLDFLNKYKKTSLEKYGVEHPIHNNDIKIKISNSIYSKYDADFYFQSDDFKKKSNFTKKEKYNDINFNNHKKYEETCLEKYGVDHPMKTDYIKNKIKLTCLEKYGVSSYTQTDDCKLKSLNSKYDNNSCFKYKEYKFPSGKIIKIQGYENFALDILLCKYDEMDIIVPNIDIKEEIGILNYLMDDKDRIYLPDIYIKSENKIIEVKSEYTYNLGLEKNLLKKEACINLDILFEFWIIDKNGKLLKIL